MPATAPELLPSELRPWLRMLRILARRARAGSGFGLHRSHSRGAGLEFAQYRAYQPGDEPRQVDWKLYARSDRFFVREAERDSALTLWLLLDTSASMGDADAVRPDWTRLRAACAMAAASVEVALRQGDRVGLMALSGSGVALVPAAPGARQRDRCNLFLHSLKAQGERPPAAALRTVWERIGTDALSVLFTDGLQADLVTLAEQLSAAGRELRCVRLLTAGEAEFRFPGGTRFVDPESGDVLLTDAPAVRADFLRRFGAERRAFAARLAAARIALLEQRIDQPLGPGLATLYGAGHGGAA